MAAVAPLKSRNLSQGRASMADQKLITSAIEQHTIRSPATSSPQRMLSLFHETSQPIGPACTRRRWRQGGCMHQGFGRGGLLRRMTCNELGNPIGRCRGRLDERGYDRLFGNRRSQRRRCRLLRRWRDGRRGGVRSASITASNAARACGSRILSCSSRATCAESWASASLRVRRHALPDRRANGTHGSYRRSVRARSGGSDVAGSRAAGRRTSVRLRPKFHAQQG